MWIASPLSPHGYPVPFHFSWCCQAMMAAERSSRRSEYFSMSWPSVLWDLITSHSASSSFAGFNSIASGMAILPMSCIGEESLRTSVSASDSPYFSAEQTAVLGHALDVLAGLLRAHLPGFRHREDDLALRGLDLLLQLGRLEHLARVGGGEQQVLLVLLGEPAGTGQLVDGLVDADRAVIGVLDRQRQHGPGAVAGPLVDVLVETVVAVGVVDDERLAVDGHPAGDALGLRDRHAVARRGPPSTRASRPSGCTATRCSGRRR